MSLWVWLLEIVWRGLDILLHLWRIDREMREGKWDDDTDDTSDSSRACRQRSCRARRLTRRRGTR
ncbi:MAG: hypothetical protein K6U77_04690 [Armatimonadetes bacterium]|nr:hypothetical protein [Armatimonadota bacterium]